MVLNCIYPAQKRRLQHIYFGTCPKLENKYAMGNPRCPPQKLKLTTKKLKRTRNFLDCYGQSKMPTTMNMNAI